MRHRNARDGPASRKLRGVDSLGLRYTAPESPESPVESADPCCLVGEGPAARYDGSSEIPLNVAILFSILFCIEQKTYILFNLT